MAQQKSPTNSKTEEFNVEKWKLEFDVNYPEIPVPEKVALPELNDISIEYIENLEDLILEKYSLNID